MEEFQRGKEYKMARNVDKKKKGLSVGFVSSDTPESGRDLTKSTGEKYTGQEGRIDSPRDYTKKGNPIISDSEFSRLSDENTGLNARQFSAKRTDGKAEDQDTIKRREGEARVMDEAYASNQQDTQNNIARQREENPEAYAAFDKAKQDYYDADQETPFETPEERDTRSNLRKIMDNPATPVAIGVGILALLTGGVAAGVIGGGTTVAGTTAAGATFVEGATTAETLATTAASLPTTTKALTTFGKAGAKVGKWTSKGKGLLEFGKSNMGISILAGTAIAGKVASTDTLATWFAADNLRSAIPFQLNDVVSAYQVGAIDLEKANEYFDQASDLEEFTTAEINKSTMLNPELWAAKKRFQAGAPAVQTSIELKKLQLTQSTGGQY